MLIKQVMTRNVEVIRPNTSVEEAATKMKDLDVGSLPVCDGTRMQGMLTDRDITIRVVAAGMDAKQTKASDVMTDEVYYCYDDQDVQEAAGMMKEQQIRRLPIVDRNKDLVGIVSLGDLAVDADNDAMSGDVLEEISRPAKPER